MKSKNLPLNFIVTAVNRKWRSYFLIWFISFLFSHALSAQTSFAGDGNNSLTGAYTINQAVATGGTNFNSFADFSTALTASGVTGNVTATVVAGSGPYTEQVIFQNTAIIQTGSNPNRHIIRLIGLQYFTVNNLHIDMFTGSTGFIGVHVLNSGNNITISNCVVNMGAATSTLLGAFVANGAPASILTPGGTFNLINITGNTVTGGGYGASVVGLASPLATNIVISNNNINNFNSNGVYLRETNGAIVSANHFDKSAGSTASTNAIQLAQSANINGRVHGNFIKMSQTAGSLVFTCLRAQDIKFITTLSMISVPQPVTLRVSGYVQVAVPRKFILIPSLLIIPWQLQER